VKRTLQIRGTASAQFNREQSRSLHSPPIGLWRGLYKLRACSHTSLTAVFVGSTRVVSTVSVVTVSEEERVAETDVGEDAAVDVIADADSEVGLIPIA
jgi:hypothetical protein